MNSNNNCQNKLKENIVDIKRIGDRIIGIKHVFISL